MNRTTLVKTRVHPLSSSPRRGERGIALILCIGFLAILSILGVVVLNLTDADMKLSAQDRQYKDVFFTADRAVEFALSPSVYLNLNNPGDTVDLTDTAYKSMIETGDADLFFGEITYEGFGGAPANAGKYDKKATAGKAYRYFHIEVEARRPGTDLQPARIDALMVQAFPTQTNVPVEYVSGRMPGSNDSSGN